MQISVIPAIALMLANGWTDAPLSIASAVRTGALKFKTAVILAAVCNLLGGLFATVVGSRVAIGILKIAGVGSSGTKEVLLSGVSAVVIWAVVAYIFSVPTSESHALLSALAGAAAFTVGLSAFKNPEWLKVLAGLLFSTLPSLYLAKGISNLLKKSKLSAGKKNAFLKLQIMGTAVSSFAHGAQDGQKFASVLTLCLITDTAEKFTVPPFTVVISCVFISLGMLLGGKKIVNSLGAVASKNPISGFSADISSGIILTALSVLGFPVSTTHAKTFAILGADGNRNKEFFKMLFAWGLTFPACISLGYLLRFLFSLF